jgi:hypothetical protein
MTRHRDGRAVTALPRRLLFCAERGHEVRSPAYGAYEASAGLHCTPQPIPGQPQRSRQPGPGQVSVRSGLGKSATMRDGGQIHPALGLAGRSSSPTSLARAAGAIGKTIQHQEREMGAWPKEDVGRHKPPLSLPKLVNLSVSEAMKPPWSQS